MPFIDDIAGGIERRKLKSLTKVFAQLIRSLRWNSCGCLAVRAYQTKQSRPSPFPKCIASYVSFFYQTWVSCEDACCRGEWITSLSQGEEEGELVACFNPAFAPAANMLWCKATFYLLALCFQFNFFPKMLFCCSTLCFHFWFFVLLLRMFTILCVLFQGNSVYFFSCSEIKVSKGFP